MVLRSKAVIAANMARNTMIFMARQIYQVQLKIESSSQLEWNKQNYQGSYMGASESIRNKQIQSGICPIRVGNYDFEVVVTGTQLQFLLRPLKGGSVYFEKTIAFSILPIKIQDRFEKPIKLKDYLLQNGNNCLQFAEGQLTVVVLNRGNPRFRLKMIKYAPKKQISAGISRMANLKQKYSKMLTKNQIYSTKDNYRYDFLELKKAEKKIQRLSEIVADQRESYQMEIQRLSETVGDQREIHLMEVNELREKIQKLQKEIKDLRTKQNLVKQKKDNTKERKLERELVKAKEEIRRLEQVNSKLQRQNEELCEELYEKEHELYEQIEKSNQQFADWQQKCEQLAKKLSEKEDYLLEAGRVKESLFLEIDKLKVQLEVGSKEIKRFKQMKEQQQNNPVMLFQEPKNAVQQALIFKQHARTDGVAGFASHIFDLNAINIIVSLKWTSLRVLGLWKCRIGNNGLTILTSICWDQLAVLELQWNEISKLVWQPTQFSKLKQLWLGNNKLTDLSANISELQDLTKIALDNNQFVSVPNELRLLGNLKIVHLKGNRIMDITDNEIIRALKKKGVKFQNGFHQKI